MGGRILAIKEGDGYRPVIVVKNFNFLPQLNDRAPSTWVYGDQIMWQYDNPSGFISFLRPLFGQTLVWCQVGLNPNESEEQIYAIYPRLPIRLVMEQPLRLLASGKDPTAGYWVQFAGSIELFSQPDWWVDGEQECFP